MAVDRGWPLGIALVSVWPAQPHLGSWHSEELWKRRSSFGTGSPAVRIVLAIANMEEWKFLWTLK